MTDEIKSKLIDTPILKIELDSFYNEWINQDEVINNLIDEATVLTIANERVKDRMLSISKASLEVREKNDALIKQNYELKQEVLAVNKKLDTFDDLVRQKALEMVKDVERELYTYAVGDKLYLIVEHYNYSSQKCSICNGTHKITVKGQEFFCPNCNAGFVYIKEIAPYEIREITVHSNCAILKKRDDCLFDKEVGKLCYTYKKDDRIAYDNLPTNSFVFKTKEEAEQQIIIFNSENGI